MDTSTNNTPPDKSGKSTPALLSSGTTPGSPQTSPMEIDEEEDKSPVKRAGLRSNSKRVKEPSPDPMAAAMTPLTDEERREWPGWVELESEPALFNFILRQYGVRDVKVQEVLGLEDGDLNMLPKPTYGLIFLFKYWEIEDEETPELPKCPNHVWFANQTVNNVCATIALLNIVMNVPNIDLGEKLSTFRAKTKGLKPAYRGQELGGNEFIRNIHNSFARRMDMLNADLFLSNDVDKWKRIKNAKKRKGSARKSQAKSKKKDEEDPGFHFIAYVPIDGIVWRLDGMQRQPANLGEAGKDWMSVARENINLHIVQHNDDGLQFNLMTLCRSPLRSIPETLAANLLSLSSVEASLTGALPDWKAFIESTPPPLSPKENENFGITPGLLASGSIPASIQRKLKIFAKDPTGLLDIRRELLAEQSRLQNMFVGEAAAIEEENDQAARRKIDYTPVIYESIRELAEKGLLKEIVRDLIDSGKMKPS